MRDKNPSVQKENGICTFFYGLYMDPAVLSDHDVSVEHLETARLNGYKLEIGTRANVSRDGRSTVYGVTAKLTINQLKTLYSPTALGGEYYPVPVLVEDSGGNWRPCLCYVRAPSLEPVSRIYVENLLSAIAKYSFPAWYVKCVEEFGLKSGGTNG